MQYRGEGQTLSLSFTKIMRQKDIKPPTLPCLVVLRPSVEQKRWKISTFLPCRVPQPYGGVLHRKIQGWWHTVTEGLENTGSGGGRSQDSSPSCSSQMRYGECPQGEGVRFFQAKYQILNVELADNFSNVRFYNQKNYVIFSTPLLETVVSSVSPLYY